MDLALALPTLSVVAGSLFGGGGGWTIERPANLRGKVEAYCRGWVAPAPVVVRFSSAPFPVGEREMVTTVSDTRSPDFRIRFTTRSWLACLTSSPLIWNYQKKDQRIEFMSASDECHHLKLKFNWIFNFSTFKNLKSAMNEYSRWNYSEKLNKIEKRFNVLWIQHWKIVLKWN